MLIFSLYVSYFLEFKALSSFVLLFFLKIVLLAFQARTTGWTSVLSMNMGAWTRMCASTWAKCVMESLTAPMAGMRGLTAEVINTQKHAHTSDNSHFLWNTLRTDSIVTFSISVAQRQECRPLLWVPASPCLPIQNYNLYPIISIRLFNELACSGLYNYNGISLSGEKSH